MAVATTGVDATAVVTYLPPAGQQSIQNSTVGWRAETTSNLFWQQQHAGPHKLDLACTRRDHPCGIRMLPSRKAWSMLDHHLGKKRVADSDMSCNGVVVPLSAALRFVVAGLTVMAFVPSMLLLCSPARIDCVAASDVSMYVLRRKSSAIMLFIVLAAASTYW